MGLLTVSVVKLLESPDCCFDHNICITSANVCTFPLEGLSMAKSPLRQSGHAISTSFIASTQQAGDAIHGACKA